jgi:hypothetical protein
MWHTSQLLLEYWERFLGSDLASVRLQVEESWELMDLRIGAARKLALAISGWFGGAKANSATDGQLTTSHNIFPQSVDVIPSKLKVRIFLHEIEYEKEIFSCWSYVTDGLVAQRQKEIIFTLRRDPGQKPEEYPRELLDLFATFFQYAERGKVVDVGQSTLFGETGMGGDRNFRGIGYIEPQGFPGVETKGVPLLAGILLKNDEAQVAWDLGLTRVTSLLGMKYRYYPCPTWSDLKREPVASLHAMEKSHLWEIARVPARASYYEERKHIFLTVLPSSQASLQEFLNKLPPTKPLALRTQPDPRANACLVWPSGHDQPVAITPAGSDGSRKTGAFLAFIPEQDTNEIQTVEDGFFLYLTNSDWRKIREALLSGTDVFVSPAGVGGASISVVWAKPTAYTSPVTGETYTAERWTTYYPETTLPPKELVAVSSSRFVLLTSEHDLQERSTAEELAAYVNAIENVVDTFFTPLERRTNRELTIQLALTAAKHEVRFIAVPDLSADVAEGLHERLESVSSPKVGGPVKLDFILSLWSVASKQ